MTSNTRLRTARPSKAHQLAELYPLSIVIPAHNAESCIEQCLDALFENDLRETEIILVDDGSRDRTADLVSARMTDSPLDLIRNPHCVGPAAARNLGLAKARHPHVFFLDSDVILPPHSILWLRETLQLYSHREDVKGALGLYSETIPHSDFVSNYKNLYTCYLYETTDALSPFIHTPIFCVERDLLGRHGGFDDQRPTGEDFRLGITLGIQGHRFVIDRRIRGVHLKRYTLRSALTEDARRIQDLSAQTLTREEREFAMRAHRPARLLSLLLPGPIATMAVLSVWFPAWLSWWLFSSLLFALLNLKFLNFLRRRRGLRFALGSTVFLFFEMLAAEVFLVRAVLSRVREPAPRAPSGSGSQA